jgi:hypothetical protein
MSNFCSVRIQGKQGGTAVLPCPVVTIKIRREIQYGRFWPVLCFTLATIGGTWRWKVRAMERKQLDST